MLETIVSNWSYELNVVLDHLLYHYSDPHCPVMDDDGQEHKMSQVLLNIMCSILFTDNVPSVASEYYCYWLFADYHGIVTDHTANYVHYT